MFTHFGGGATLPEIGHSLRFNSADSAYLSKTLPSASGVAKSALSLWVKRTSLGAYQSLFVLGGDANNYAELYFNATDSLVLYANSGGSALVTKVSSAVFRDVSAHYHVCCLVDTTLATAEDRFQLWVNGVRLTSFSTNTNTWTQNYTFYFGAGSTRPHWIGANYSTYFNGYISRVCFVYNATATPSDFAYTDPNGQWRSKSASSCKTVVDAGSINSFMLDFNDGSSTTALGYDYSAKGNNWTLTNFTRSAGVNDDWMTDTPTNNYCVLSVVDKSASVTISNGGLAHTTSTFWRASKGSIAIPAGGKYYWEIINGTLTSASVGLQVGVATAAATLENASATGQYGAAGVDVAVVKNNGSTGATLSGGAWAAGTVLQVAADAINGKIWIGEANTWWDSSGGVTGDPAAGTNPTLTVDPAGMFPFIATYQNTVNVNFGQRSFAYTPPTGFKALCTKNLPTPSIVQPNKHFDIKTYSGNAGTQNVTWLSFQPDLVWAKSRGRAVDHALYDAVRGVQKQLESNQTGAETTETTGLTSFNSDGWTMGALDQINGTTATNSFVGWAWKANGAGVSNTDGSITSTVNANQAAGFSIVTFTGTGANATVGHGLGVAPKLIIAKNRGGTDNWVVGHNSIGWTEVLNLNLTNAKATTVTGWNNTAPTSSVFSVGTYFANGGNYVAYCFAEIPGYSKIGSYTGNGSDDGPFVWCGFRPRYLMVKRTDSTSNWEVVDTSRDAFNKTFNDFAANLANAENVDGQEYDILSNGFKLRNWNVTGGKNTSGGTYVFIAFAEHPFKYANAR